MSNIYEGCVGAYTFKMESSTIIEVWTDLTEEYPESYIHVKEGSIKNEKDFHMEISDYYLKNLM